MSSSRAREDSVKDLLDNLLLTNLPPQFLLILADYLVTIITWGAVAAEFEVWALQTVTSLNAQIVAS